MLSFSVCIVWLSVLSLQFLFGTQNAVSHCLALFREAHGFVLQWTSCHYLLVLIFCMVSVVPSENHEYVRENVRYYYIL